MNYEDDDALARATLGAKRSLDISVWLPWQQVWKLVPGAQDFGFAWTILGSYDPRLTSGVLRLSRDDNGQLHVEGSPIIPFTGSILQKWGHFLTRLKSELASGKIEVCGHEGRVSGPLKPILPEYWRYWRETGAGPVLSQDIVVLEDTPWFNVKVRHSPLTDCEPVQQLDVASCSAASASAAAERKRPGKKPGPGPVMLKAREIAEKYFEENGIPQQNDGSKAELVKKIQNDLANRGETPPGNSSLYDNIKKWALEWRR